MRAVLPAAVIVLLAGVAAAQTPASPPTQLPTPKPRSGGDTLSGVTVTPLPKKACAPRDKDCITMVVAELKRLYPEELKRFCFEEQTKQARTQFVNDQLLESLNSNHPPPPMSFQVSPVIKTACASDKK